MRLPLTTPLLVLLLVSTVIYGAAERMIVLPLDARVVTLDSGVSTDAFAREEDPEPDAESPDTRIVRAFHPRFTAAVARAARGVKVIRPRADSIPTEVRYTLRVDSLAFSIISRTVTRRFVPPSPAGFDPATGEMSPGERRGRVEGPGWMNTLSATAVWTLWDRTGDSAAARGTAKGASTFRSDARRSDWDAAARELAKDVLRGMPFTPSR